MKILALNGSPRRDGAVAGLLKASLVPVREAHDVEWVNVCDLHMAPCTACMACRQNGGCVLPEDGAHRVGERIRHADALVVGTPTHWGNMCAPLKLLFDRNVPVFMGKSDRGRPVPRQKGKRALIVTACDTPWPFDFLLAESRGAVRAVRHVLRAGGYRIIGSVARSGRRRSEDLPARLSAKAQRLGGRLAQTD